MRFANNPFTPTRHIEIEALQPSRGGQPCHNLSFTNTNSGMCLMINMIQRQKPGV